MIILVASDLESQREVVNKSLVSVLDESMRNIFGESTVKAVYYYLERKHLLRLEDVPKNPAEFMKAIREIFGDTGAEVIESFLVKDLCEKFRIDGKVSKRLIECLDGLKWQHNR